ncbi:hypothetical protein [Mycobacterium paragordonae]|uniref:Uncharacterized protein n=1 Tax=Mycobacterium paragordonae TaxID=1389713 RepID=A0AAJ1W200_9MYCO|nr:hypothetical protein [Mycobacterium paragordonae]MDP7735123.1 hypothetical protein [Mycobacterium paragordonae]
MIVLLVLGLGLIVLVVGGLTALIMRACIPSGDTQRRAEFDRKAKNAMAIGGGIVGGALVAAARSDKRNSANFARSWDLDNSQFHARQAAQQTADYNRQVAAYNQQVGLNNAPHPLLDPLTYNNVVARNEVWWMQHGGRAC